MAREGISGEAGQAQHPAARRTCRREGSLPASLKGREGEREKEREHSSPFLLGAPKNALLYNQKHAPNISHLRFFILSFGDQGGSRTERRGPAAPEAAPRQEVLQAE